MATIPNIPIWFPPSRITEARKALEATTEMLEWSLVQGANIPQKQRENMDIISDFLAGVILSIVKNLEEMAAKRERTKPPTEPTDLMAKLQESLGDNPEA